MMPDRQHLVDAQPLQEDGAELLDALEDVLGERPVPLRLYEAVGGVVYWDPESVEITLLSSPHGAEYHSSITPEDLDGTDDLRELIEQRYGGGGQ